MDFTSWLFGSYYYVLFYLIEIQSVELVSLIESW